MPLRSGIRVVDCRISLPWTDKLFLEIASDGNNYRLAGIEYPYEVTVNRYINDSLPLVGGWPLEGSLILSSCVPFPAGYRHGMPVKAKLTFIDQFDNQVPLDVQLGVDLEIGWGRKAFRQDAYAGLFDGEVLNFEDADPVPDESHDTVLHVRSVGPEGEEIRHD
jgi:hypothetical protein